MQGKPLLPRRSLGRAGECYGLRPRAPDASGNGTLAQRQLRRTVDGRGPHRRGLPEDRLGSGEGLNPQRSAVGTKATSAPTRRKVGPMPGVRRAGTRLAAEAVAAGVGYSAGFCWLSTCLVGSFRVDGLARPYWSALGGLRTDTTGIFAFAVAAICIAVGEYLRLDRRHRRPDHRQESPSRTGAQLAAQAVAETVAVLSTLLVAYLSVNAVTHPQTLEMQATHFARLPTEGTLRVLALLACALAVGVLRYVRAAAR